MKKVSVFLKENWKGILLGVVLTTIITVICWPERIAELKNGEEVAIKIGDKTITADTVYTKLKDRYGLNAIVDEIDKAILDEKYELTETDLEQIEKSAENYYTTYENYYGITKEEFLSQNGFETHKDFIKYLELEYKRNLIVEEYLEAKVTDKEVEDYYKDNYFAEFEAEHILVQITEDMTKENAKKLATEILDSLKGGTSWKKVKEKYKDKITVEELDVKFDSNYEESFVKAAKKLKDGKYTLSLVQTSYGFHIIKRIETKETEELSKVKNRIVDVLVAKDKALDTDYYQKTLITMRETAGVDIKDTELNKVYNIFVKSYKETKETE